MNAEDFMEEMLNRIKALSKDINENETNSRGLSGNFS